MHLKSNWWFWLCSYTNRSFTKRGETWETKLDWLPCYSSVLVFWQRQRQSSRNHKCFRIPKCKTGYGLTIQVGSVLYSRSHFCWLTLGTTIEIVTHLRYRCTRMEANSTMWVLHTTQLANGHLHRSVLQHFLLTLVMLWILSVLVRINTLVCNQISRHKSKALRLSVSGLILQISISILGLEHYSHLPLPTLKYKKVRPVRFLSHCQHGCLQHYLLSDLSTVTLGDSRTLANHLP